MWVFGCARVWVCVYVSVCVCGCATVLVYVPALVYAALVLYVYYFISDVYNFRVTFSKEVNHVYRRAISIAALLCAGRSRFLSHKFWLRILYRYLKIKNKPQKGLF